MISSQIYVRLFRTFSLEKHKIIPKKVLISYHMISYLHILSKHVHILMYKLSECWRFHQFCARPRLVDEGKLSFRIICIFSATLLISCKSILFLVLWNRSIPREIFLYLVNVNQIPQAIVFGVIEKRLKPSWILWSVSLSIHASLFVVFFIRPKSNHCLALSLSQSLCALVWIQIVVFGLMDFSKILHQFVKIGKWISLR